MVLGRAKLVLIFPQEVNRVGAPGGEEEAERREKSRVAAQKPVRSRRGIGRRGEHRQEQPRQNEEGRDDRDRLAVPVLHGQSHAATRAVPLSVGEILRGGGTEE